MNARNNSMDDDGSGVGTPRVSARTRFASPPVPSPSSASFDYGNNDNHRVVAVRNKPPSVVVSRGGINGGGGGGAVVDDDGDAGGGAGPLGGRGPPSLVKGSIGRQAQQQAVRRSGKSGVVPAAVAAQDRPWRTTSSSISSSSPSAASYATASRSVDLEDTIEYCDTATTTTTTTTTTTLSPARNRWAQYETDDLEEESRRATSNAVVGAATRLASGQATEDGRSVVEDRHRAAAEGRRTAEIMGGAAGTGYGGGGDDDCVEMSTTDYVKSRLSLLLNGKDKHNDDDDDDDDDYYRRGGGGGGGGGYSSNDHHDRVRDQALKMLHLADSCLQDSPRGGGTANSNDDDDNNAITALFRTRGGGLAMREMHGDEVETIVKRRGIASIAGLDRYGAGGGSAAERSGGRGGGGAFTIGSHDEDDPSAAASSSSRAPGGGRPSSPNEDTPSLWSSRYSVERQLMAITGGLDSTHMLAKMDMLHSSREKTKSARGMYRSSGHAMDGSHVEYGDYTQGTSSPSSLGGFASNLWLHVRGTLWSDDAELNHDGTTQSLVRREKAMGRRRRTRIGLLLFAGLCIAVGVLVHRGNPKRGSSAKNASGAMGSDVNFYVVADEPYEFSNIAQLTKDLEAIPPDADFVVHLGNVNGDEQSQCQEYGFERAAAVLKESPVPVLIIPGDLDWAACGSEEKATKALNWWKAYLGKLEDHWDQDLGVEHDDAVIGNFAFARNGVLFVGITMVDGFTSPGEATSRLERNVLWTKEKLSRYDSAPGSYRAVVIFGHAPPSDIQGEYFWPMLEQFRKVGRPVLYVHANKNGSFERYAPYDDAMNFSAVQLEKRGIVEGLMKVVVAVGEGGGEEDGADMFVFDRREANVETSG